MTSVGESFKNSNITKMSIIEESKSNEVFEKVKASNETKYNIDINHTEPIKPTRFYSRELETDSISRLFF